MSQNKQYLSAEEVIEQLAINKATLYSYVSRGLIRSEETQGKTRKRRYSAEDVEALLKRKENRRNPERAAESALQWGDPVLESAITLIENNELYYRGVNAWQLAEQHSFEEVAALLWDVGLDAASLFTESRLRLPEWSSVEPAVEFRLRMLDRFQMVLPLAAAVDLAAFNLEPSAVAKCGARILRLLATLASEGQGAIMIAKQLQLAWSPQNDDVLPLLNSALILCADHELNASSFTARCAASAGSNPYAVVNAGLSALQGFRHGGHTERVEALFREAAADPRHAVIDRIKRGEGVPGFGHQLYPLGDPRARFLLQQIESMQPLSPALHTAQAIIEAVEQAIHLKPNIDFVLVTLAQTYGLPSGSSLTLFALGRIAGWIGHAIEQYGNGRLIRPRARYVGKEIQT
ncbi:MAG: citrate synthase family protein [Caldilineaceae bacterium]